MLKNAGLHEKNDEFIFYYDIASHLDGVTDPNFGKVACQKHPIAL